jgi:hypothetical protein
MRRVAVLACLLACASSCSILVQADASKIRTVRTCPNVKTKKITGRDVEVPAGFGCSGARKVMRKYFHLVVDTGQTAGGCAQKRSTKGCKIMRYRCFTKYVSATNELKGHCNGPNGIVRFIEIDRGPN